MMEDGAKILEEFLFDLTIAFFKQQSLKEADKKNVTGTGDVPRGP
jgi:hypothetical protein